MKTKTIFFATLFVLLLTACNGTAQNQQQAKSDKAVTGTIEIIQFHSEHRCMTCNKIEILTKETLQSYASIPFSLINVDDKKNEKQAADFEASGTSLFLYNRETGRKKNLTDFAFMNAGDRNKFINGLREEIANFK